MQKVETRDGLIIHGDCMDQLVVEEIDKYTGGTVPLIYCDPPYGRIVSEEWDQTDSDAKGFARWLLKWTREYSGYLEDGGAFYVWGAIGKPGFRPFLEYIQLVERCTHLHLKNWITWSKKRAYGTQFDYLFTRQELAYFIRGDAGTKPLVFNVPLLDEKRVGKSWSKKYQPKSEYLRRTNVWTDVTEIMQGKVHPTEKPTRLAEIVIEAHTKENDIVLDMFAGSGSTGVAARNLGRRYVLVEKEEAHFRTICRRLGKKKFNLKVRK